MVVRMHGLFQGRNPGVDQKFDVEVRLLWDSLFPEAVHVRLAGPNGKAAPWMIEREMLAAGINQHQNHGGDIRLIPALGGKSVILVVGNRDLGELVVTLRTGFVAEFIERTVRHAPLGTSSRIETAPWWNEVSR